MNGGYSMIDCTGLNLGNPGTVTGLYEKALKAIKTGKPLFLNNVVNGDQAFTSIPGFGGIESSTSVFISFVPVTIHISNADVVTI